MWRDNQDGTEKQKMATGDKAWAGTEGKQGSTRGSAGQGQEVAAGIVGQQTESAEVPLPEAVGGQRHADQGLTGWPGRCEHSRT